jgi:short-chain fatty acids transporter
MKRVVILFTKICEAYLPDAFVFCLILTLVVFGAASVVTPFGPLELVDFWGKDFWSLNAFAMQMVFILISGHMLASTPLVQSFLHFIVKRVETEKSALVLISLFSTLACFLNWGFGLIVSGLFAVELAKKLKKVNFGLFVATAYSGFLVWHGGLSGSIPLKISGKDEILTKVFPDMSVPLSATIFSTWNLALVATIFLIFPFIALSLRTDEKIEVQVPEAPQASPIDESSFRFLLENFRGFNLVFFFFFALVIVAAVRRGEALDISKINGIFLFLALLLHGTPRHFLKALQDSIGYASGIIIQFPFYAGLMGLMQYSGLADQISLAFLNIATPSTLPMWTFLSGGLVNFFIPSGGGQWVVQGPIMLKAAHALSVDPGKVSMALAWGDAWTNLIQPFWALPLLALAKLQLKDIMGYCLVYTFVSGLIISAFFLWF